MSKKTLIDMARVNEQVRFNELESGGDPIPLAGDSAELEDSTKQSIACKELSINSAKASDIPKQITIKLNGNVKDLNGKIYNHFRFVLEKWDFPVAVRVL